MTTHSHNFPAGFKWGVSTAAYQIEGGATEGGRGQSIWDTFSHIPGNTVNGDTGDVACDHYHLWPQDIEMMKSMGVKDYRMSIAWPRLFPQGDGVRNEAGFKFYDDLINGLLAAGITPLVTLYHWDLPQALQDKGGWVSRATVDAFEGYATAVAKHFGDRIKNISPINEPWVVSYLGHGLGVMAPGAKSRATALQVAHHTVIAHAVAFNAIKAVDPTIKVGPVINQANHVPDDAANPILARAADVMDAQQNRFWMDAMYKGSYPEVLLKEFGADFEHLILPGDYELMKVKNDFIGVNFYFDERVGLPIPTASARYDVSSLFGLDIDTTPSGELTDMNWPLTPWGLRNLLLRWHRELGADCPDLYITENGAAYDDGPGADGEIHDARRVAYLKNHISAVHEAIAGGAPVKGYYQWSLMDNFEWALGYAKRFGIVYVDYATQKRTLKDSAKWYVEVMRANGF